MQTRYGKFPDPSEYASARPFPHCEVKGFIDSDTVDKINAEWPEQSKMNSAEKSTSIKSHSTDLPPTAELLARVMASNLTIRHLEVISGIDNLVYDDGLSGGGLHQIDRGGFLKTHVDFNQKKIKKEVHYRRLNVLIYLTKGWADQWGGHLELSDDNGPMVAITPEGGTLAMFNTSESSWHGHPYPLNTPEGTQRRSMAFYYYTKEPPECYSGRHSTIYRDL